MPSRPARRLPLPSPPSRPGACRRRNSALTSFAAGAEILARRQEFGDLLAREEGKTLPEAVGEVVRAGNIFKFFAGEALRSGGDVLGTSGCSR